MCVGAVCLRKGAAINVPFYLVFLLQSWFIRLVAALHISHLRLLGRCRADSVKSVA